MIADEKRPAVSLVVWLGSHAIYQLGITERQAKIVAIATALFLALGLLCAEHVMPVYPYQCFPCFLTESITTPHRATSTYCHNTRNVF